MHNPPYYVKRSLYFSVLKNSVNSFSPIPLRPLGLCVVLTHSVRSPSGILACNPFRSFRGGSKAELLKISRKVDRDAPCDLAWGFDPNPFSVNVEVFLQSEAWICIIGLSLRTPAEIFPFHA